MTEAYPLQWPPGWPRTKNPIESRFGTWNKKPTVHFSSRMVFDELRKMGAKNPIISSNMTLRLDGNIRSAQKEPHDSGVAVYFKYKGNDQCFPCDRWKTVGENLWAIYKSIDAIRGLERWGAKEMVNAAFRGFQALPSPDQVITTAPDYFNDCIDKSDVKSRFKNLAKELHPDVGGNEMEWYELKRQYEVSLSNID